MKRKVKPLRPLTACEAEQLLVLGALDNRARFLAYQILHDEPDISFNAVARRLGLETGLAAYHLGVLKVAGLVGFRYVRRSRATTLYRLTSFGERWYERLFGPRGMVTRRTRGGRRRVLSKRVS